MSVPASIKRERARMKRAGFLGRPERAAVSCFSDDRTHYMAIRRYTFPAVPALDLEPHTRAYVEIWETHDRGGRAKIVPVRDLVHCMQNMQSHEFACMCTRRGRT